MDGKPLSGSRSYEAIVIGGGLAGLAAACHLAEAGFKVTLLEKGASLGGRASSFPHPETGEEVDTGQHVFMRCCTHYIEFLQKLGILHKTYIQPRLHVKVFARRGKSGVGGRGAAGRSSVSADPRMPLRVGIIASAPLPAPMHLLPSLLTYPHISFVDRLRVLYGALCILFTRRQGREGLKETTFYSWLRRRGQSERAIENLWNLIVLPTLNEDVYRASAHWGIMLFQEALLKGAHNADIGYSRVGLGSLVSSAATSYIESRGGKVITGRGVRSLEIEDGSVDGAALIDGTVLKADLYLCSLPADSALGLLPEVWREDDFFKRASEISWSPIVNVYICYDRQVMDAPFAAFLGSEAQWVFNRSLIHREDGSSSQKLGVSLSGAWKYIGMSRAQLEELFVRELSEIFPAARDARVLSFAVVKQRRATFSATPGGEVARLPHRTPIANFFLAGDWTDTGWPSTMEGAVRSGVHAASEIVRLYR